MARCTESRGFEFRHDEVVGERGELNGCGQPAREVGFKGRLVVVAGSLRFTGDFDHDVITILRGKEDGGGVKDEFKAIAPLGRGVCLGRGEHWVSRWDDRETRLTRLYMFAAPMSIVPAL